MRNHKVGGVSTSSSDEEEEMVVEGQQDEAMVDGGDGGGDREEDSDSSSFHESDSDSDSSDFSSGEDIEGEGDKDKVEEEEVDEEDPVIRAIEKGKEKKVLNRPVDLKLDGMPSTLAFHPVEDRILFGNYDGELLLYSYSLEENKKLAEVKHSNDSPVRGFTFTNDGSKVVAAFSDQTLKFYDVNQQLKVTKTVNNATSAPLSAIYMIDENSFATGDDDGNFLLWDNRTCKSTLSLRLGEGAITSFVSNDEKRTLVGTSEEGAIYAVKPRAGKVLVESEEYKYEFNCSCVFKQESKLAVGDGNGDVYLFNWEEFGKHSDISTGIGRKEGINALIPITERILLCGGDDGFIRAFHFFPQKYLGVVGKLQYPVERMDVCNDGHLIATMGADETVKFWNVEYFADMVIPTGAEAKDKAKKDEGSEAKKKSNKLGKDAKPSHKGSGEKQDLTRKNLPSSSHQNASDFYKGLAD